MSLHGMGGREVRPLLAQPKRIALLAYLAAAAPRDFHRRDSLLALLWPELDQAHARAALRQALHGVRRSLGDDVIESRGDEELSVRGPTFWCDALAFVDACDSGRHADALELYRGDLLDGFFISGAPEFERWLEEERARLRRRACETAWLLADSRHAAGDSALAAHWARHAASFARDDEGALRRLIALLGELGDRAGAVQVYESFARRLAEEYEVEPAAETRALIASVRAQDTTRVTVSARGGERAEPAGDDAAPLESAATPRAELVDDAGQAAARPRRRRLLVAIGAASVLAALTIGSALARGTHSSPRPGSEPASLDPGLVVVAPFSNRTRDSAFDDLSELAREEVTRGLELTEVVQIADPGVVKPEPTRPRLGPAAGQEAAAAHDLALATGAGLLVRGSVDRHGDQFEVAAQIVDVRNGRILRALEPVRGDPLNPHAALTTLRDHIMAVIAESVDPRLGASASVAGEPPLYDAYLEFVTGVGIFYDGRNGRDALPYFNRAARLDSMFALPLIWAAWVHQTLSQCDSTGAIADRLTRLRLSRLEKMQIDRQMDRCRGDLPSAYRLAHTLAEARPASEVWKEQLARDALNFDRPREAVEILERLHPDRGALRRRASYYNWLTNAHHLLGQHDRELATAARARRKFPANLAALRMELLALAALGRGREVTERFGEIGSMSPDPIRKTATVMREVALDLATHGDSASSREALRRALAWHASRAAVERATDYLRFERAQTYYAAGHTDSAYAIVAELAGAQPHREEYLGLLGSLAAQHGDVATARRIDSVLSRLERPYARGRASYWRACIAARLGRRQQAVDLLEQARTQGYVFNDLFFLNAHLEPSFAKLRGYAPFRELLRPSG